MTGAEPAPTAGSTAWKPVLSDEAAGDALEIARRIGRQLQAAVRTGEPAPGGRTTGGESTADFSLGEGAAGLSLALSYLGNAGPSWSADAAASLAAEAFAEASSPRGDASLFGGLAGVGWVHAHLARRGVTGLEGPLAVVDERVVGLVSRPPWTGSFDLIGGLAGLGVYALERLPRPVPREALERIVDRLAETAEPRAGVVAWWTSPAFLPEERRAEFPRGHYNLGLAHGVPGVVAFLGRVVASGLAASGVAAERARELLDGAVAWLLAQRREGDGSRFAKWTGPGRSPGDARQAWCYGDPGVAAALLLAARSVGHADWEREALAIALHAASRPPEDSGVVDAGLCHGSAGLGHVYNRLYQASGLEELKTAASFWFRDALRRTAPEGAAPADGERDESPDLSFLSGSAGVALALLSAATPTEPEWDRVLLLSGSGRGGGG